MLNEAEKNRIVERFFPDKEIAKFVSEDETNVYIDSESNMLKLHPNGLIEYSVEDNKQTKQKKMNVCSDE